jgi:hypothetical protein
MGLKRLVVAGGVGGEVMAANWLRASRASEIGCKPRRCWILMTRSERLV